MSQVICFKFRVLRVNDSVVKASPIVLDKYQNIHILKARDFLSLLDIKG